MFWNSHGEPGSLDFGKNQSMDYARMRDLYYTLAAHTSGSHVKVYNVPNYGNVYSSSMTEFLFSK